ncbi:MAG: hypothetical protein BMS9Abin21_103 [Thermodesulfovibrionia bacterium]|nr:MAG: hypothetical protein BMS9Abin21_103 [Thermodesulfovibrionia bacterium]
MSLHQLIANPKVPNLLQSFQQGQQGAQLSQLNRLKIQSAQSTLDKQGRVNKLLQQGASVDEIAQEDIETATKMQDFIGKQSKQRQADMKQDFTIANALLSDITDNNDPRILERLKVGVETGQLSEKAAGVMFKFTPSSIRAIVQNKKDQGFTLGPGQRRFAPGGNEIARGGPSTTGVDEERKQTLKANIKRLGSLESSKGSRQNSIKRAQFFLDKFIKGEVKSGAGRATARFIPGVFTEQGKFDELLDSFSEIAAREKLKAVGEIRPTDADVKGMKESLFGIGRDEATNVQLLREFIAAQQTTENEFQSLRQAKADGTIGDLFPSSESAQLPPLGFSSKEDVVKAIGKTITREQATQILKDEFGFD